MKGNFAYQFAPLVMSVDMILNAAQLFITIMSIAYPVSFEMVQMLSQRKTPNNRLSSSVKPVRVSPNVALVTGRHSACLHRLNIHMRGTKTG